MKKTHKKYIFFSIFLSSLFFGLSIGCIYIIDPAGINNRFDFGLIKDPALAYRTQKFVEINEFKPNTIMLGGSRVHFLDTKDVQKYTQNKVYNIGFSQATLEEQYCFLQYSIENFDIQNVIIGLNLYPFSQKLKPNPNNDFDKEILKNGFTLQKQLKHYLEVPLVKYFKEYHTNKYQEVLYKDGARTVYNQIRYIDNKSWQEREKNSNKLYNEFYNEYLIFGDSSFDYFKKIIQLCKDNNIEYKVFTTAIHQSQFKLLQKHNKMDIYFRWKKELVNITDYWDFMYLNSVTINHENYIDPSHMRQEKGYLYFTRIFNDQTVNIPKDFGVLVTKENIDSHLQSLRNQIKAYDASKLE